MAFDLPWLRRRPSRAVLSTSGIDLVSVPAAYLLFSDHFTLETGAGPRTTNSDGAKVGRNP